MAWGETGWGSSQWGSSSVSSIPAAPTATPDQRDLYKSVLMRRTLPKAFMRSRNAELAKLLAPVSESDNDLGGLFDEANFLVDDTGVSA